MKSRRWIAFAGCAVVASTLGGCYAEAEIARGNPLGAFMLLLGTPAPPMKKKPKVTKLRDTIDVTITGSIGGLSGAFDLTFGSYGSFSGTAAIGRDRKSAVMKAKDTAELLALGRNLALAGFDLDANVTGATAKVVGRQTTGGVRKSWNGTVTFTGTISGGMYDGLPFRFKVTSKGAL